MQTEIPEAKPFDLSTNVVGLDRETGAACFMVRDRPGPPVRLDGHTIGVCDVGGGRPTAARCTPTATSSCT